MSHKDMHAAVRILNTHKLLCLRAETGINLIVGIYNVDYHISLVITNKISLSSAVSIQFCICRYLLH